MVKRSKIIVVLFLFILTLTSMCYLIVSNTETSSEGNNINMGVDIYYAQNTGLGIESEKCEIDGSSVYDMTLSAIEKMKSAPKSEGLVSAIPESIEILDVKVEGKKIIVDFSNDYFLLKPGEEMMCRSAMVWTLTGLYFVDCVGITVEGEPIRQTNGEEIGVMTRENLIINAKIDPEPTNSTRTITLYFADKKGKKLVKEERRIDININENLEKYVMEALIEGPEENGNIRTIPSETKIRDIKAADGICYVDLSEDVLVRTSVIEVPEIITVYSIVNTLCELSDVKKVQFLIEGEKRSEFKTYENFDKPFEPKEFDD